MSPPGPVPRGRHLHLEPLGGIAGDMFLGACLDLGVPLGVVEDVVDALGLLGVTVAVRPGRRGGRCPSGGLEGLSFEVLVDGMPAERAGPDAVPGEWSLASTLARVAESPLPVAVRERASALLGRRFAAEAAVAGVDAGEIVWRGGEAIDTLVDLAGAAAALEHLDPESVTCGPLAGGTGGNSPAADRMVRALLGGAPQAADATGLVTPTGAVLVAELVDDFAEFPPVVPEAVGTGLGRRDFADRPNVLRLVAGHAWQPRLDKPASLLPTDPERPEATPPPAGPAARNKPVPAAVVSGRSGDRGGAVEMSEARDEKKATPHGDAHPGDTRVEFTADGELEIGVAAGGGLRYGAVDLGDVVEEARRGLDLAPIPAAALGRTMAAATLLLRLSSKTPSRLVVEVRGDGPLGRVLAETDAAGTVRGTVGEPHVDLPAGENGKLAVGAAVGRGTLRVIRESPEGSYASQVDLVSGEIGLDVAHFLHQSEQRRSAVLLGVLTRPAGVAGAGGLVVELLPGAGEETIARLEANLAELAGVSWLLEEGGLGHALDRVLAGFDRSVLERRPVHHRCRCDRDRLQRHLALLPAEDRAAIELDNGVTEGECVFCGTTYRFTQHELAAAAAGEPS